jgi:hypothetical protein
MAIQINGKTFIRPQVVTSIDDSRLIGPNDATGIGLAIMGVSTGGKPGEALIFSTAREARAALRGGELLQAVELAYGPGANLAGASRVVAVRVNPATNSNATFNDGAATATIGLTSVDWGLHTSRIAVEFQTASLASSFSTLTKIVVTKAAEGTIPKVEVAQDNVGRRGIKIRYTGTGSACTAVVTTIGGSPTIATTVTGTTADSKSCNLLVNTTLQQVVDYFNATGVYAASIDQAANPLEPSLNLDAASAVNVMPTADPDTVGAPFFAHLRCDLQAQVDWFNSYVSDLIKAVKLTTGSKPVPVTGQTFLSGGGEGMGSVNNTAWQAAFDLIQSQDVQVIVPVSADPSIHAMANVHCQTMSDSTNKRERIAIVGGAAGENVTSVRNRAANLNTDRVQLVWPGLLDNAVDGSGTIVTTAPYLVAAQKAGITAALPRGQSATNQPIGAKGVEVILTPTQVDTLVGAGVCVIDRVSSTGRGFKIVKDETTWVSDSRYSRTELSTRMALDYVATRVREALEKRIGQTNGPALVNVLTRLTKEGVLVGGENNPSFSELDVSAQGDAVLCSVVVAIAIPANYISMTIYPTVFSSALPEAR